MTRDLMLESGLTPQQISEATTLKIRWLYLFRGDSCEDYGVKKVQELFDYLAEKD